LIKKKKYKLTVDFAKPHQNRDNSDERTCQPDAQQDQQTDFPETQARKNKNGNDPQLPPRDRRSSRHAGFRFSAKMIVNARAQPPFKKHSQMFVIVI
jgi:hypothetical protein